MKENFCCNLIILNVQVNCKIYPGEEGVEVDEERVVERHGGECGGGLAARDGQQRLLLEVALLDEVLLDVAQQRVLSGAQRRLHRLQRRQRARVLLGGRLRCARSAARAGRGGAHELGAPETPARVERERDAHGGQQVLPHNAAVVRTLHHVGRDGRRGHRQRANMLHEVVVHLGAQLLVLPEQGAHLLRPIKQINEARKKRLRSKER